MSECRFRYRYMSLLYLFRGEYFHINSTFGCQSYNFLKFGQIDSADHILITYNIHSALLSSLLPASFLLFDFFFGL